jgi:hypothetical protein
MTASVSYPPGARPAAPALTAGERSGRVLSAPPR